MFAGRAETSRSRYGHALDDNQVRRPLPRFTQDFVRLALAENGLDPAIDGRYCRANSCSCFVSPPRSPSKALDIEGDAHHRVLAARG
jgi:hypothetical protein